MHRVVLVTLNPANDVSPLSIQPRFAAQLLFRQSADLLSSTSALQCDARRFECSHSGFLLSSLLSL